MLTPYYRENSLVEILVSYPNLIRKDLTHLKPGTSWGEVEVFFKWKYLDPENVPDLVIVTKNELLLFEAKRDVVDLDTLSQYKRYEKKLLSIYNKHKMLGFLVGLRRQDNGELEKAIGDQPIKLLLFNGYELPRPGHVQTCKCGCGLAPIWNECNVCGRECGSQRWRRRF